jgi:hypothetical protein
MEIRQGFSMTFNPVDGERGVWDLKLFTHLSIGGKVSTRDMLRGAYIELDPEWAEQLPADQFAVLAVEIASQLVTVGYPPETVGTFRDDIAQAIEAIGKQWLGQ